MRVGAGSAVPAISIMPETLAGRARQAPAPTDVAVGSALFRLPLPRYGKYLAHVIDQATDRPVREKAVQEGEAACRLVVARRRACMVALGWLVLVLICAGLLVLTVREIRQDSMRAAVHRAQNTKGRDSSDDASSILPTDLKK